MVRFTDVMFSVLFPLYVPIRLAGERSIHLSFNRYRRLDYLLWPFLCAFQCFYVPHIQPLVDFYGPVFQGLSQVAQGRGSLKL